MRHSPPLLQPRKTAPCMQDRMHPHGCEIMDRGYEYVVAITNEGGGTNLGFINHAIDFGEELKVASQQPPEVTMSMLKHPSRDHDIVHLFNGHKCITCIQDGEIRGYGIFAFFDTQEGALECVKHYGELY
jgi:hypothetical protein